jgi:hypothetical protein
LRSSRPSPVLPHTTHAQGPSPLLS